MGDPAILLLRDDGEVWINSECTALMFGVEPDVIARVGDLTRLPQFLIKHGIRRRKEYEALVGSTDIDLPALLMHYARVEGVELVYDNGTGSRQVLVAGEHADG